MIDFRPIFFVIGLMLATLALSMTAPAVVDLVHGTSDWQVFAAAAAVTMFVGVALALTCRADEFRFNVRSAFVLTTISWLAIAVFAALPFAFSDLDLTFTDAFFEAMSGITTTGATVITGLDNSPPGILLWRAILQWLGGIGIIVTAIAVLPFLKVGGMQLFRMESSDTSDKAMPRAAQVAGNITMIYVALTLLWALMLWVAGLSAFDSIAHAMTTIATAGFSTRDASIAAFQNIAVEWIIIAGMLIGGLPFVLYLQAMRGSAAQLFRDSQVRWFLIIAIGTSAMMSWWHISTNDVGLELGVRQASFNIISNMTGTGYTTTGYDQWGGFAITVFLLLMFVGGCAGSTSCGIKIFRFQVLYAHTAVQLRHLLVPHGVFIPYFNRRPIPEAVSESVLSFFFVFALSFVVLALGLGLTGLDFLTSVSAAATAISNVGPGLGEIVGPTGNFQPLPDAAKWMLTAGMLLGRLEVFTVLIMLTPAFWRR
ncbi:MAG: TrkH family potassium uptake protein [Acetobacterales bacterium]